MSAVLNEAEWQSRDARLFSRHYVSEVLLNQRLGHAVN